MDAQQQPSVLGDRFLVIGETRAVGRPDFPELRSGFSHDVGDAKRTTDLNQFSARDDDLSAIG